MRHDKGKEIWAGVDIVNEGIADNLEKFVWEPTAVKVNAIQAATEAACLILSVDETISEYLCSVLTSLGLILISGVNREPRVCGATNGTEDACWDGTESTQV